MVVTPSVQPAAPAEAPPEVAVAEAPPAWADTAEPPTPSVTDPGAGIAAAREALARPRPADTDAKSGAADVADADADPDDQVVEEDGLGADELLQRELGATMIEEIRNQ